MMNGTPNAAQPVLDVIDLSVSLPAGADRALAVDRASLSVLPGQTLCVVGESGSGKSMIANAVMGLLPARTLRRWPARSCSRVSTC
jgi:ABC-type glutathione transport system ATPase component